MLRLTGCVFALSLAVPHAYNYAGSIQPLAWHSISQRDLWMVMEGELDPDQVQPTLSNHCTVWAYVTPANPTRTHWITAAHCVLDSNGDYMNLDYQIAGHELAVEDWNVKNDIASLSGDLSARGLTLATNEPAVYDPEANSKDSEVVVRGYPFGYKSLFTTHGSMSLLHWHDEEDPAGVFYNVYQVPIASGSSGSPVFDSHNKVIGVLQIGWGDSFSSMAGGSSLGNLRAFLANLP